MFPGGSVNAPSIGFSISIEPPHFAQRVFTFGRSPSRLSSNLYLDWQLGQVMIIDGSSPRGAFRMRIIRIGAGGAVRMDRSGGGAREAVGTSGIPGALQEEAR
jgi:hypothetical protein